MDFSGVTTWAVAATVAAFLSIGGGLLASGSVLFGLLSGSLAQPVARAVSRIAMAAVLIGLLGTIVRVLVQAGRLLDDGLAGMADPEMLDLVAATPRGEAAIWRTAGLVLILASVAGFAGRSLVQGIGRFIALAGALLVAASFAMAGHATGEPRAPLAALITVHILGVSFWIGALLPLRIAAGNTQELAQASAMAERFGRQAAWIVGALVVAGAVMIWLLLGSWRPMFETGYGLTLLAKLTLVSLLLALAAMNKLRFVPAMGRGDGSAALALRRSIAWEIVLVCCILLVTIVLTVIVGLPEKM